MLPPQKKSALSKTRGNSVSSPLDLKVSSPRVRGASEDRTLVGPGAEGNGIIDFPPPNSADIVVDGFFFKRFGGREKKFRAQVKDGHAL